MEEKITINELKEISQKFRSKASQVLKASCEKDLSKLRNLINFIRKTRILNEFIQQQVGRWNFKDELKRKLKSPKSLLNSIISESNDEKEVSFLYQFLEYVLETHNSTDDTFQRLVWEFSIRFHQGLTPDYQLEFEKFQKDILQPHFVAHIKSYLNTRINNHQQQTEGIKNTIIEVAGDYYEQSGKLGIGSMSGGEIKDNANVSGMYRPINTKVTENKFMSENTQQNVTQNIGTNKGQAQANATGGVEGLRKIVIKKTSIVAICSSLILSFTPLLNIFQPIEFSIYDLFFRLKTELFSETQDNRILLVLNTSKDVNKRRSINNPAASISDKTLEKLFEKIIPLNPKVIALNIYRDYPVSSDAVKLKKFYQSENRIIGVCNFGDELEKQQGIAKPPDMDIKQIGFINIERDSDGVLRRQLIGNVSNSICPTTYSFDLRIALLYLDTTLKVEDRIGIKINNKLFRKISKSYNQGIVYHNADTRGYQFMLNFRANKEGVAKSLTVGDILDKNKLKRSDVEGKIIIIGTTYKSSYNDYWNTPLGEMFGVKIHAHGVSQIISAILDQRPLITFLPKIGRIISIFISSVLGGGVIIILFLSKKTYLLNNAVLITTIVIGSLCLTTLSFILFTRGIWIPVTSWIINFVVVSTISFLRFPKIKNI